MILSIESSCDDSSIALTRIEDCKLLYHKKISQELTHSLYGGVVPEIASRMHANALPLILKDLFMHFDKKDIKAIAITTRPGLSVTLIEGLMMAKTLALELEIPIMGVNHLKGHIYSIFINNPDAILPLSSLLVSGGHTQIIEASSFSSMKLIAQSMDDSFGESFDKVAKMLGLPYPGGPQIEKLAKEYSTKDLLDSPISLPIPLRNHSGIAFSFSGLKNAIRLEIQKSDPSMHACIAKSFQSTAIAHLLQQTERYFKHFKSPEYFALVGGASANKALRQSLETLCQKYKKNLLLAPLEFCSDNAAMIGRYARECYLNHQFDDILSLQCSPKSLENEF